MLAEYLLAALFEEGQSQIIAQFGRTLIAIWESAKSENRSKEYQNLVIEIADISQALLEMQSRFINIQMS